MFIQLMFGRTIFPHFTTVNGFSDARCIFSIIIEIFIQGCVDGRQKVSVFTIDPSTVIC